jgi:hypothetical protein
MTRKVVEYTVRCTAGIAAEMARYEGGKIRSQAEPIQRYKKDPERPELDGLVEATTTYLFTIASVGGPCMDRWESFRIKAGECTPVVR